MAAITPPSPNTTITTAGFGIPVATELNTRCLKIDGLKSSDGTAMQMTGDLLLRNASPTNDNHAARKKYVDDSINNRVATTGDTMTGALAINEADNNHCLSLRTQYAPGGVFADGPYLSFVHHNGTPTFGTLQGHAGGLALTATTGAVNITSGTGGDINLNSGGAQVRTTDPIYVNGGTRSFHTSGACLQLIGTGNRAELTFYSDGSSVDSVGAPSGGIGYPTSNHLYIRNFIAGQSIIHQAGGGHIFQIGSTPAEVARFIPGSLIVGKAVADLDTVGVSMFETGTIYATRPTTGSAPIVVNRLNSVDNEYMIQVCRNGSTIGRIEQSGTTGVAYVTSSDRRQKTIQGEITDAVDRVKAMKPYRVTWIGDPSRGTTDAFIADEMAGLVPEAVSGEANAVTGPPQTPDEPPEGTPIMQGMDYSKLVTVVVAALQNVIERLEVLEAA